MVEKNGWVKLTDENPDHSAWYIQRFKEMAASGKDLSGESRFINALVDPGSRILDAGCGPGRVGSQLAALGHHVVGVDIDPILIAEAQSQHPEATWHVQDLAALDLQSGSAPEELFDCIVCAGNVMTFLATDTRVLVIERLRSHLTASGRLVIGFGSGRGYDFEEFFVDARSAGLDVDLELSTWDVRSAADDSDFLVALLTHQETSPVGSEGS